MLMLSISSAGKLVTLAMASFMLASSSFAAPMVNLHRGDIVRAIDCVKIQDDSIHDVVVQGEQTPIKIDVSGCEPSLLDTTHPWTVTLVNCEHHEDTVKLAELVGGAGQKEYTLSVNTQPSTLATPNNRNIASTTGSTKYHIQVDTISKDGAERLTGRSVSFKIAPTTAFQKRDDDVVPPVDITPIPEVVSIVDGAATPEVTSPVDGAAIPEVASPVDGVAISEVSSPVVVSTIPEVVDVNNGEGFSPAAVAVSPAAPADLTINHSPTLVATPAPSASPSPTPAVIPSPTYPNVPLEIIDPSTPVEPTGPNQAAPGDPAPPKVIHEPKKKPSAGEVFLKYAGAGSAILSTLGLGLGGVVGGVIGGAAGLLIGVTAALINSLYYAPNVA
ncbi:hypothetical protein BGZ97_001304 [Linnemannia gamsii]|uniref:Uncharacterized protein n=1 Tax=Linnemannia gamsii TaxID=64522 RepID=A0A9P6QWL5_9FUNG|nr:hypothetical protein BGZ97_001304 [Linnemannia gamsii]